jgi:hypothetical protein
VELFFYLCVDLLWSLESFLFIVESSGCFLLAFFNFKTSLSCVLMKCNAMSDVYSCLRDIHMQMTGDEVSPADNLVLLTKGISDVKMLHIIQAKLISYSGSIMSAPWLQPWHSMISHEPQS